MKTAAYTGTKNLYPMMYTAVKSLLLHSDVDKVYLLIEDNEFPYELPDCVETINVRNQRFFYQDGANWRSRFSYMAMMRATFSKIFPSLDRILSLDVDTIVTEDISGIWDLPIDDCYLAASEEPKATAKHGYMYVNIGVCLYNLKKLRDGKADEVIAELNAREYKFLEQDAFSELCQGGIYDMPSEYNSTCGFTKPCKSPKIIHYASMRKWDDQPAYLEYEKIPMTEVKKIRKNKKDAQKNSPKYVIHTYPGRLWYVEGYLVPSMMKQGIPKEDITVWNDKDGVGNLEACIQCFEAMPDDEGGAWHLQDDVVVSRHFAEMTRSHDEGFVCGFSNVIFDGKTVGYSGLVPMEYGWFSFQCNRFPNRHVRQFAEWYRNEVVPKNLFPEYTKDGKCDDSLWQRYVWKHLQGQLTLNIVPNLVDHIDYLIGGSAINKQRQGIRRSYYWNEPETIDELEKWLSKRNK